MSANKITKGQKQRPNLLPRSVLGITSLVLAFSIGATLSGVVLFGYYDYREKTTTQNIEKYIKGFASRFDTAKKTLDAKVANGQAAIDKALEPINQTKADGKTTAGIAQKHSDSVWYMTTLDDAGQASVGTAFAVFSDNKRTLLITSYTAVKAATKNPGPAISVTQNGQPKTVDVQTWDEGNDLALLVLNEGNHTALNFAPTNPSTQPGTQVFAVSGFGSDGASALSGFISDVSGDGVTTSMPIGPQFRGAPIIDSQGRVIAVASVNYAPANFVPNNVYFAPMIRNACSKVLTCPNNDNSNLSAGR